jgi:GT2 family glycosyltransferase
MLLRSWALKGPGLFDEALEGHGNETEWMMRYRRKGGRIVYLPEVPVLHRRGRADLHLASRLRKGYEIGRQRSRFESATGQRVSSMAHLAAIPRHLAHSVKKGCTGGLMQAAQALGYAREARWQHDHRGSAS